MRKLAHRNGPIVGMVLMLGAACLHTPQVHAQEGVTESLRSPFVTGGEITIELSAGTHEIRESPDDSIRIRFSVGAENRDRPVKAITDVDGLHADIELDGPRKDFRTVIEVPRQSDLIVHLTAGELSVGRIQGDKEIRIRAGELSIEVGDGHDYRHAEGSVWAGEIDAGPFGTETGGLFRSFDWSGKGKYDLSVRIYAGEIRVY